MDVFPEPVGPTTARVFPAVILKEILLSTVSPLMYAKETFSMEISEILSKVPDIIFDPVSGSDFLSETGSGMVSVLSKIKNIRSADAMAF